MCGLAGLINLSGQPIADPAVARAMGAILTHRGPEDEGCLLDGPVAFAFRRLRIIDLETGHQPVANEAQTIWAMLNGEIYNFVELRRQLEQKGHQFQTQSDTEVIVHAYESHGLDFVHYLRGMFAIALWDSIERRLILVRDRVGKKPLFYSQRDGQLAFASELKALLAWPGLQRTIHPPALHDYLTFLHVPGPASIFAGVYKVPPAHFLVADGQRGEISLHCYWRPAAEPDRSKPLSFYAEGLQEVLAEAVHLRLRSDVPLGAFLSGGIDSTIIVGLMSVEVAPVRTFNIAFPDPRFDESRYASLAAAAFGARHTCEMVDDTTFTAEELARLVWHMDEPFGDSSFIPTYWVAKTARQQVTVALSGDGGDELFAGYDRYRYFQWLGRLAGLPHWGRLVGQAGAAWLAKAAPSSQAGRLRQAEKAFALSALDADGRILALNAYFNEAEKRCLYSDHWQTNLNGYASPERWRQQPAFTRGPADPLARFLLSDFETKMVDDYLVKVDRAAMACALEVRSPFLDHHVVEFAMRIPPEYKLHNRAQKIVLKQAFTHLLPPAIARRGKQGFEIPIAAWFQREPWRSLLGDTLSDSALQAQGIFDPAGVVALRDELLRNPEARHFPLSAHQLRYRVWALFVFQLWWRQFMAGDARPGY
ncbi:MAG: asparagine synthase (glutamine-hydrolyzing) [Chloroflexi bacterium]|nr:asparagine synthase (glutamine-hydrolyzing) [Chloroflexota bacterium]MCI0578917.1 asparagine synthase (glutamine-hydrolyzing) [Chloroflexota bacterium]MCI0647544.1 asparagine synthase (glutamine-hydrolyzing) [Chloroflexota bacterium]MCI0730855.1 asparagine synthase (glutamine-hydrolyzing) [Chloroflexota bacterium]